MTAERVPRPYRGIAPDQRVETRRARFIEAGTALFGGQGYHATTVRALCAEAKLTERYFYESFANTEDLLVQVYRDIAGRGRVGYRQAAERAGNTMEARVTAALDSYFRFLNADPLAARVILIEIEGVSEECDRIYRHELQDIAGTFAAILGPELPVAPAAGLSADLLSFAMIGGIYQLAKEWLFSGRERPVEALVANSQAMILAVARAWKGEQP